MQCSQGKPAIPKLSKYMGLKSDPAMHLQLCFDAYFSGKTQFSQNEPVLNMPQWFPVEFL